jgi:hypothetical protein
MLEAIDKIRRYTHSIPFPDFVKDGRTIDAVVRNLSIIGEAATYLPANIVAANPQIPWREMIGMRNKVIHEYFGVDEDILWKTITEDLPRLRSQIEELRDHLPPGE